MNTESYLLRAERINEILFETEPVPVLLLQKQIKSYFKSTPAK